MSMLSPVTWHESTSPQALPAPDFNWLASPWPGTHLISLQESLLCSAKQSTVAAGCRAALKSALFQISRSLLLSSTKVALPPAPPPEFCLTSGSNTCRPLASRPAGPQLFAAFLQTALPQQL